MYINRVVSLRTHNTETTLIEKYFDDSLNKYMFHTYLNIGLDLLEKILNGSIGIDKRGRVMLHQLAQQSTIGGISRTDLNKTNLNTG